MYVLRGVLKGGVGWTTRQRLREKSPGVRIVRLVALFTRGRALTCPSLH